MGSSLNIIVVTGVSGAGKSTALRVLEDLGFFCVDNLPAPLVGDFLEMAQTRPDISRVALGMDARGRVFGAGSEALRGELIEAGYEVAVLFLDASDEALVRRFSESRRPHPLSGSGGVPEGIRAEREALWQVRSQADHVIDTTLLNVHELRRLLHQLVTGGQLGAELTLRLVSFGFRYGVPVDADLLFDVRFLPNPYFNEDLRQLSGQDQQVGDFVFSHEVSREFLDRCVELLEFLLPHYRREGKSYLTTALGCTGGRHRSVALVERLAQQLEVPHSVNVTHRDMVRHQSEADSCREVTP